MGTNEITIDGCIDVSENPMSAQEFTDKFLGWLEENNFYFGGTMGLYINDDITIEEMDFTVRVYNALKRGGINFKSEIENMSNGELLKIRGINVKTLQEIKEKLEC